MVNAVFVQQTLQVAKGDEEVLFMEKQKVWFWAEKCRSFLGVTHFFFEPLKKSLELFFKTLAAVCCSNVFT